MTRRRSTPTTIPSVVCPILGRRLFVDCPILRHAPPCCPRTWPPAALDQPGQPITPPAIEMVAPRLLDVPAPPPQWD